MKLHWFGRGGFRFVASSAILLAATSAIGQEQEQEVQEGIVQTETRSAAIVISAEQDGSGGPPTGVFMLSTQSNDGAPGGVGAVQSFSFGDVGGNMFVMGGEAGPSFRMGAGLPMIDPNNWGSLLNIPEIRQELDIMDAQFSGITQARQDLEKSLKQQINDMVSGGVDPARAKNMAEMIRQQRTAIDEQVREHLLPNQIQRLKEIALHMQMKQTGAVGLLGRKEVMEELEISSEQLEALQAKAKKLEDDLKARVEELKKKAQAELIRELKPEQRKKLEAMMGKEFEYKAPEPVRQRVIRQGIAPEVKKD